MSSSALVDLVNRTALCIGIAAAVYSVTATISQPPPTLAPTAVAEFGILDEDGNFVETDVVPLVIGQQFGWRLALHDTAQHSWREVMVTPAAPREWIGDDLVIEADGTMAITERTEVAYDGGLTHGWSITEGDPAGPYLIQLFLDGEHLRTMRFVLR